MGPELGPCLDGVTETCCEGGSPEDGRREEGSHVSASCLPHLTPSVLAGGHSDSPALSPSFACNQEMAAREPGALSAEPYTLPEAQGEAEEGN